ncbi:MAG: 16S rRNA (cytosine(967)-C(5))-methyltransferase RsmB [Gammaproteobacteria bacterium]|nr:16S rRNA (cytosine(967)-C(5))-methyltransferase RsmB [Gammaproteobacteria bacterium]
MARKLNTRALAARATRQIIDQGRSLDAVLPSLFEQVDLSAQNRSLLQELVYGVCRWYGELDALAGQLLRSPIRNKDRELHFLLLVGLYQLRHLDTAQHAAVAETVSGCQQLNKAWAKKLINGCLRSYLRQPPELSADAAHLSHPKWIAGALETAWPDYYNDIVQANNQRPPMCLRVNRRQGSRDQYLEQLHKQNFSALADPYSSDGIVLQQAAPVTALPAFAEGAVSVQDTAAQLACDLLAAQPGESVLDACAAPGGKTAHLLERHDDQLALDALDISARRCEQLQATLNRLQLDAHVVNADAADTQSWDQPDGGYDRIMIDAPCSGLGVLRRHPDIRHHRTAADVDNLVAQQQRLLHGLWPLLKPGGRMLYLTCSILPAENNDQIDAFLASHGDAMLTELSHPSALVLSHGVQTLPGVHEMDGFFYSALTKAS